MAGIVLPGALEGLTLGPPRALEGSGEKPPNWGSRIVVNPVGKR